jgi:hypothetical protein
MIGDGNAVGVAGEIAQHMLWAAKGRLEVNHPFLPKQRTQEGSEGLLLLKRLERAGENQLGMDAFSNPRRTCRGRTRLSTWLGKKK